MSDLVMFLAMFLGGWIILSATMIGGWIAACEIVRRWPS